MAKFERASVLAIGTANPPNIVYQADVVDEFFRLTGCESDMDLKSKMKRLSEESMIHKRHIGHIFEDIHKGKSNVLAEKYPTIDSRAKLEYVEISKLGAMAASKAIEEWAHPKSRISHIIVHSNSGIKMPGLDFEIVKILGLQSSIKRYLLYHYGCMAGGTTLRMAKDIAENNDGARVLVICAEVVLTCLYAPSTTNLQFPIMFGEGASALIVGANPNMILERPFFQIFSASQIIIPNTEALVTTKFFKEGIMPYFQSVTSLGNAIANNIESSLVEAVSSLGITDWNQLFWISHPGSSKIMDAIERKLNLKKEKLKESRLVLREYGNMMSATVFFVMDGMRKSSLARGLATTGEGLKWGIFLGIGPGMTLETIVLRSFPIRALHQPNAGKVSSRL